MTLCPLRTPTVLSCNCCAAGFGLLLTKVVMSHAHDGPGATAPLPKITVPLTGVWNPLPSVIPLLSCSPDRKCQSRLQSRDRQSPSLFEGVAANRGIGPNWPNRKVCWALYTGGGLTRGGGRQRGRYRTSSCQVTGNHPTRGANRKHSAKHKGTSWRFPVPFSLEPCHVTAWVKVLDDFLLAVPHFPRDSILGNPGLAQIGGQNLHTNTARRGSPQTP